MDSSGRILLLPVLALVYLKFMVHKLHNGIVLYSVKSHDTCVSKTSDPIPLLKIGQDFILQKFSGNRKIIWLLSQVIQVAAQQRSYWVRLHHQLMRLQRQKEWNLVHYGCQTTSASVLHLAVSMHNAYTKCKLLSNFTLTSIRRGMI